MLKVCFLPIVERGWGRRKQLGHLSHMFVSCLFRIYLTLFLAIFDISLKIHAQSRTLSPLHSRLGVYAL